jgi:hypothetical protein
MKKNLIASAIAAITLAASGSASAIVVGGVDFGAAGNTNHIETTTLAETLVNAVGQTLSGYGQINSVNGNIFYAGADRLYFTFTYDVLTFSPTAATFNNGVVNVYKRSTINLLNQSSAANMGLIDDGILWAVFKGHDLNGAILGASELDSAGFLTGASLSFTGAGLLDVVAGGLVDVQNYMDANGEMDLGGGFADVLLTTSGNNSVLNPFDNVTGCAAGTAAAGTWCIAGSADLRGKTVVVPEPSVLALLGLGLLGLGFTQRKRKSA